MENQKVADLVIEALNIALHSNDEALEYNMNNIKKELKE